jgi:hypothetical protein
MSRNKTVPLITTALHIRQNGLRSVNVEQDLGDQSIIEGYVLTTQARTCSRRILNRFEENSPGRSWTLTGPYGSGKSYFSLFLMNLMGTAQSDHSFVLSSLLRVDPDLAEQAVNTLNHGSTKGLLPVPITGYRASLQECILHGLLLSLERLNGDGKIKPLLDELLDWTPETESRTVIHWLKRFIGIITQPEYGYLGMMLVFDEMGKPLEYSASHSETSDVYILQELAEYASRSGDKPFVFIGILHQAFDRYALHLDRSAQREWSKVQGRFEDIAFQEPPAQQIRLLANAIDYSNPSLLTEVLESLQVAANGAVDNGWAPSLMKNDEFIELSTRTYPFHPTALVALPYIFHRLAQNERSVFAYLSSFEPAGFQEFIQRNPIGRFIRLPELFDYLFANFQGRLFASLRARAITETMERLNSTPNLDEMEAALLKTIGLLNWLAEVSHLQANEANVIASLLSNDTTEAKIHQALEKMALRSLIVYRRFNKTYSIWQGSDVDIEERLQKAQQQLTEAFSFSDAVQEHLPPRPIVARRHSYLTGTLRYFEVRYVDTTTRDQIALMPAPGASGFVFLCLPLNLTEVQGFNKWAEQDAFRDRLDIVIGVAERTGRVTELLYELRCLDWVEKNTPELRDDPVARRELRTRFAEIQSLIQNSLDRSLSIYRLRNSIDCRWFQAGKEISEKGKRGLSHLLSETCDTLYDQSPIAWNEIVNRRLLSSQGAAARRNLIEAMLTHAAEENLGIEGFPPERSMYESLLSASGLHLLSEDGKRIFAPPGDDPLRLQPAWQAINEYIFTDPPETRKLVGLIQLLNAPPYGLTDGIIPIILCAFLIVYQDETTLYREGSLLPEPGIADWEILLRRPELFGIAGCRITGTLQTIVERFALAYHIKASVMPVVRTLVRGIKSLPEHTLRTRHLSDHAKQVRSIIEQARSPEALLFVDLPAIFGMKSFSESKKLANQVDEFFEQLSATFSELVNEMPRLLAWGRDEWLTACGLEKGEDAWGLFRIYAADMLARTSDNGLLPLLKRASETEDGRAALESVLAYIASRPPRTWTDADTDRFQIQAKMLGRSFQTEREGTAFEASLSPEQRKNSRQVAEDIRGFIQKSFTDDPQILKAALQALLKDFNKKSDE